MKASVHISLRVRDLDSSIDFYRRLFGDPAKLKFDYAKFVMKDPEIHLALAPGLQGSSRAGSLSHLGIRVGSTAEIERWRAELIGRGTNLEYEKRSKCCYALQEKFWLNDPDGNRWEIYTVLDDVETMEPGEASACCPSDPSAKERGLDSCRVA